MKNWFFASVTSTVTSSKVLSEDYICQLLKDDECDNKLSDTEEDTQIQSSIRK